MKRTILLIALLLFSVAGLLFLSLGTPQNNQPIVQEPVPQTVLSLTKPVASQSAMVTNVLINTNGNKVTAVQLELSYNPQDLSDFKVEPGNFFTDSVELLNKIDGENGKITYALGVSPGQIGKMGNGVLAKITFQKLKTFGTTEISFDPKSLVTVRESPKSVLRSATGIKFDLSQ